MTQDLERLQPVAPREVWPDEARDFTPWLAKEENLAILGETLGMALETKEQEKSVGPFKADILCVNVDDGSDVLIENQLEETDHKHLGQLMTYAAGLHTAAIVWIAKKFTEKHRAAIDWLNEITGTKFHFFGIEIEVWRIGDSKPAPKFNIVAKPNDWSRSAARSVEQGGWTKSQKLYHEFWSFFCKYLQDNSSGRSRTPPAQHWMDFAIGRSGMKLCGLLSSSDNRIGFCFQIEGENSKDFYDLLLPQKEEIEAELGFELKWDRLDDRQSVKLSVFRWDADLEDRSQWEEYCQWMKTHLDKLDGAFRPRVKDLNKDFA